MHVSKNLKYAKRPKFSHHAVGYNSTLYKKRVTKYRFRWEFV